MRISDWSSDVCASDLLHEIIEGIRDEVIAENGWQWREGCTEDEEDAGIDLNDPMARDTLSVVGAIKAGEASARWPNPWKQNADSVQAKDLAEQLNGTAVLPTPT